MPGRVTHLLAGFGGVASRAGLLAAGATRGEIQSAVRAQEAVRVAPGLYALSCADRTEVEFRRHAALARFGPDAALTHQTAAALFGLRAAVTGETVHVAVRHGSHTRSMPSVRSHQCLVFEPIVLAGYPVVSPRQALAHLAKEVDIDRLRFPALAAVQRRLITPTELADPTGVPRTSLGRWRCVAEEAAAGAEAGGEGRYWQLVRGSGLPLPVLNQVLRTPAGDFRLDAWWQEFGLVAEIDGRRHHTRELDFERDRVRQNAIHACGLVVIRFPVSQVMTAPVTVLDVTYQNLLARSRALGVRPPAPPVMPFPS